MATGTIQMPAISGTDIGYYKSPDGLLIQWGYAGVYHSGATNNTTVTLPISFSDNHYIVVVSSGVYGDYPPYEGVVCTANVVDKNSFLVHQRNVTDAYTNYFRWIAIGRWDITK